MDRYVCYYCQKAYEDYPELIKHLCFKHANDIVKYRERELEDSASGRLGYRIKYFQDIIPSKCITHDNRLSISNVDNEPLSTWGLSFLYLYLVSFSYFSTYLYRYTKNVNLSEQKLF